MSKNEIIKISQAASIEAVEKQVNDYFYSSSYKLEESFCPTVFLIVGKNGKALTEFEVHLKKGRYIFYSVLNKDQLTKSAQ